MINLACSSHSAALLSRKRRSAGFTLVELIMVLVIIGILAVMTLPSFGNKIPVEAANTNAKVVMGTIGAAAANYKTRCAVGLGSCDPLVCQSSDPGTAVLTLLSGIQSSDYTLGGDPATGCTIRHQAGTVTYTTAPVWP
ncbi:type II secretion system protein [Candidatus Magnetaquicoccus inordinatus]|uniref:type II secretion system protein n=1 Tax=Candidatus Magnetaquicoccus inordinatus TaxID=2496818 RepID=UPI00102B6B5A|nr:type II secretion system protein [Candidatus Magnetaquicoccus inordinatus]